MIRIADGGMSWVLTSFAVTFLIVGLSDGLFGIGLQRDLSGEYAVLIETINSLDAPVLALDIPSGLDADSGRVLGCAIAADHTITFITLKPGLLTLDGPDHCGTLHVADLGLAGEVTAAPHGVLISDGVLSTLLPPRPRNSHKEHLRQRRHHRWRSRHDRRSIACRPCRAEMRRRPRLRRPACRRRAAGRSATTGARAGIEPWAWIINTSIAATSAKSPLLRQRAANELREINAVASVHAQRYAVVPLAHEEPVGVNRLLELVRK